MSSARDRRQRRPTGWDDWRDETDATGDWSLSEADAAIFGALRDMEATVPTSGQALVRADHGVIVIGDKLRWTPVGLEISGELLPDEWFSVFKFIRRVQSGIQWIIGDWLVYGEEKLGKTYPELAQITHYSEKTLRNLAAVARAVPMSRRRDTLSFGHHAAIAALPAPGQQQWLDYAAEQGLSVMALRRALGQTPHPAETDERRFKRVVAQVAKVARLTAAGETPRGKKRAEALVSVRALQAWLAEIEQWLEGDDNG